MHVPPKQERSLTTGKGEIQEEKNILRSLICCMCKGSCDGQGWNGVGVANIPNVVRLSMSSRGRCATPRVENFPGTSSSGPRPRQKMPTPTMHAPERTCEPETDRA